MTTTPSEIEIKPVTASDASSPEPSGEHPLAARVEALLISAERPLTEARLGALLGIPTKGAAKVVQEAIETLNAEYERSGRAFRAERLAGGWQLLTTPEFGSLLAQLHADRKSARLSQAAIETLAIIAYRSKGGGIMRAEIEAIRGVACGEVLRGLLERRLVKVTGRAEELGRPMLYGVTSEFLKAFGLASVDDLPEVEGLRPAPKRKPKKKPEPEAAAESTDETPPEESPEAESEAPTETEAD